MYTTRTSCLCFSSRYSFTTPNPSFIRHQMHPFIVTIPLDFLMQNYSNAHIHSKTMYKPVLLLLCLVALTIRQAMAMKICSMQPDYPGNDRKVKTYQGTIVKQFDEADTPAMQGNDCVTLWCRAQCENDSKCKKFSYLAMQNGRTTCTLYSKANVKNVKWEGKGDLGYGKCRGEN